MATGFDKATGGVFSLTGKMLGLGAKKIGGAIADKAMDAIRANSRPGSIKYPSLARTMNSGGSWSDQEFDDNGDLTSAYYTDTTGVKYVWHKKQSWRKL